jgi:hypothetical protein
MSFIYFLILTEYRWLLWYNTRLIFDCMLILRTIYRNHGNIGKQTIRHELSCKQIGCILQKYYTITALERDQYEVLWSRVQQYWTRRSRVQYCCTLLHKTLVQNQWMKLRATRVQYGFLLHRNSFLLINMLENFIKFLLIKFMCSNCFIT